MHELIYEIKPDCSIKAVTMHNGIKGSEFFYSDAEEFFYLLDACIANGYVVKKGIC